jgi:diguanylate cyclase (GGDEF)-like protein
VPQSGELKASGSFVSRIRVIEVLVVDDDDDDLYFITEALEQATGASYRVKAVTSPLVAMVELSKTQFDVILTDYRLGPLTGVDFIRDVRKANIETPMVLLTGMPDSEVDEQALAAGASDFVSKLNINPDALDRSIRYAMAHAERQRLLQAVLRSTNSGVAVVGQGGDVSLFNPRFTELAALAHGEAGDRVKSFAKDMCALTVKDAQVGDHILEVSVTALKDQSRVIVLHDVTQRVHDLRELEKAEQQVRAIAMKDGLTELPNRLAFNDYLDSCFESSRISSSAFAVLSFDFNRFKEVNDVFGHAAGDLLLKTTAARLRDVILKDEYAARLGGDEFSLVQINADVTSATGLAKRINEALCQSIMYEDKVIEPSVSIGIAFYPEHGKDRHELLANADLAMYRAKTSGGLPVCVFGAQIDKYVRERRKIAFDLKNAISDNELELYYQPQFSVADQTLQGFEALLRWKNKTRGFVSPAEFIPVAEENGLIHAIDEWVLREACTAAARNPNMRRIAVNISAKAIGLSTMAANVRQILIETGLSPSRLELEVTETALIQDLNRALHCLRQLKSLGITIAMDDFGTGYSSLSLLNSFPFDRIKIDKSFVQSSGNNKRAGAIFKTVIGLGKALEVPVLVEGVETHGQLSLSQEGGCDEVQGYYFSKPLQASVVESITAGRERIIHAETMKAIGDMKIAQSA